MVTKIRAALLVWEHRQTILIAAVVAIALPFMLLTIVAGAFLAGVPMVPDRLIPLYRQAVEELTAPDGTKVSGVDWHWPVAIDAVRFRQDWSKVTESSIHELVQRFIKRVERQRQVCTQLTDPMSGLPVGQECHTETYYTYELYPPEAVMGAFMFSTDQAAQAMAMASTDVAGGGGTGDCTGFMPNPAALYFWPLHGWITSCFGPRTDPVEGGEGFHTGVDIAAIEGTPIRAAQAGSIHIAAWTGNYGNLVVIVGDGEDLHTWYGHLSAYAVSAGQHVAKGEIIGYVGSTGKSSGPHLHFETRRAAGTRPVDPLIYYR